MSACTAMALLLAVASPTGSPEFSKDSWALPAAICAFTLCGWTRPSLWGIFRIFAHPFEAVGADDGVSRRDESISTGRERPGSAPRGPGLPRKDQKRRRKKKAQDGVQKAQDGP